MDVHVNAAESVDGKLSTRRREQLRISGPDDFDRVDRLRADADAVMVGIGTVVADDPHLTLDDAALEQVGSGSGSARQPARVVVDSSGRTPTDARILDETATTYLLVSDRIAPARRTELAEAGAEVIVTGDENRDDGGGSNGRVRSDGRVDLADGLAALADEGIDSLMVEGGGELIFSLFDAELVDTLTVFVGSMIVGGRDAPTLVDGEGFVDSFPRLRLTDVEKLDDGVLLSYDVGQMEPTR